MSGFRNNAAVENSDTQKTIVVLEGNYRARRPVFDKLPTTQAKPMCAHAIRVSEVVDTLPEIWGFTTTDSIVEQVDLLEQDMRTIQFDFYGVTHLVSVPKTLGNFHPVGIKERDVEDFTRSLSCCRFQRIISDCNKYRVALGYNDWAVLKLIQALAWEVFPANVNGEQEIFTAFILDQMGLHVRVARADSKLIVLFASVQEIYAKQYITYETCPLYLVENISPGTDIFPYNIGYKTTARPLDLRIAKPIRFPANSSTSKLCRYSSVWTTTLELPVSNSLVGFYRDYPQIDPKFYASAALDQDFVGIFKRLINREAAIGTLSKVNELLSFLQHDFKYKVDQEQFSKEKPFFCEENFIYAYNDCEDRSILLSSLIRNVLGLKVVLLDYKQHMAVAVCLDEPVKGDYLVLDEQKYYVCDPTYIGASVGMSMPQYKNRAVTVYRL